MFLRIQIVQITVVFEGLDLEVILSNKIRDKE